jgi:hypothetical protein
MKGKTTFTIPEADEIRELLAEKITLPARERKSRQIRKKLRVRFQFFSEDFAGRRQFGPLDFDDLVRTGQITITGVAASNLAATRSAPPPVPIPAAQAHFAASSHPAASKQRSQRADSDEAYVIDLCDEILGRNAIRQHRFPFLKGDGGHTLPVDAYYSDLNLVVEYRERQHTEAVKFFDRRQTVSGVSRGEQRRLYDQRRREILPARGIQLIEVSCTDLAHHSGKRLRRDRTRDRQVLRETLASLLPKAISE